jgi:hypothetical protein
MLFTKPNSLKFRRIKMNYEDERLLHAVQDLHNALFNVAQGIGPSRARDDHELSNSKSYLSGTNGINLFSAAFEQIIQNQKRQIELLEQIAKNTR